MTDSVIENLLDILGQKQSELAQIRRTIENFRLYELQKSQEKRQD